MSHHHHDQSDANPDKAISFPEKAQKLISHWIKHNEDHAQSYHQWADAFRLNGLESAASLLDSAADLTQQINISLSEASRFVDASKSHND